MKALASEYRQTAAKLRATARADPERREKLQEIARDLEKTADYLEGYYERKWVYSGYRTGVTDYETVTEKFTRRVVGGLRRFEAAKGRAAAASSERDGTGIDADSEGDADDALWRYDGA